MALDERRCRFKIERWHQTPPPRESGALDFLKGNDVGPLSDPAASASTTDPKDRVDNGGNSSGHVQGVPLLARKTDVSEVWFIGGHGGEQ